MQRDVRVIVTKIDEYYDIILTVSLVNPRLFVTDRPYAGEETFLCPVKGVETVVKDPLPGRRSYFVIKSDGAPDITVADRLVDVPLVPNFRDQGGYLTTSGQTVKWGRFFRGGAFAGLDEAAKQYIDSMDIRGIYDYRDVEEAGRHPDYVSKTAQHYLVPAMKKHSESVEKNRAEMNSMEDTMTAVKTREDADEVFEGFCSIYLSLPFENPAYKALLEALDNEDTVPLYQHCTMGKDRTGVGCAMILLALGVDRDTVMGDYCLSATYRAADNRRRFAELAERTDNPFAHEVIHRCMTVEPGYLQASFDQIDQRYPDFETFLREEYQVTADRLAHWRSLHLV